MGYSKFRLQLGFGQSRTWKNNNHTSCRTPRCVKFFVKVFTNCEWSFNRFNIIPSVLILEPSGHTSGFLGEWLTKPPRWIVELLWLPMALQLYVSWRPLPFCYLKCALHTSFNIIQPRWVTSTRTWLNMLNSFWNSMYEQGLQRLQTSCFWGNVFVRPTSKIPVQAAQHCHPHCRQV